jgi:hypothetical protein
MHAQMQLTCEDLRRQLKPHGAPFPHRRHAPDRRGGAVKDDEALGRDSTITRACGDETVGGGYGRPLTLMDIRRNQEGGAPVRLFRPLGDETALRYRYDEAEIMVQDQSLVPEDLRDMDATAGRRCCRVVKQGAAVGQSMWRRKKANRSLSALAKLSVAGSQTSVAMAV